MRIKHWMFIIGLLGIAAIAHADTLTNLDEITDPDDTDLMYIVDVSEGSGDRSKKITIDNLKTEFEAVGSGDNWSDPVDSDILPPDDTYDIGASSYQFANGWFDGTLEADTLTEDGNAVYNSSETPGGELGGTWAAPTLDDSVTVDDWTLSSPTITTEITATGLIGDEDLQSEDFGDFTCAGEDACTLDADTIAAAEMADADHGDVAWTGGVAQVQDLSITSEATGSMLYYDGANWVHLAAGSNDDVVKLAGGVPTWAAGAGFSDLTDYEEQTAWRVFYSDADGDVTELALGADGDMLQSNGAAAAPTWETPPGAAGGDAWGDAVDADIIPDTDDSYDLGDATHEFTDGFFDGTLEADTITDGTATLTGGVLSGTTSLTDGTATLTSGGITGLASLTFTGADASPNAAGEVQYDSTITGLSGGGLRWYDDDSVRVLVDLETDPSDDDYVVSYDADADGFYLKADADSGGYTAWDNIGDPSSEETLAFAGYEQTITSTLDDVTSGIEAALTIQNIDTNLANDTSLLDLKFYQIGDSHHRYIQAIDNTGGTEDVDFYVGTNGKIFSDFYIEADFAIFGNSTDPGSIRLEESTNYAGDNYVAIAAPANVASSISFTLPDDFGTAGYVLSDTDGAGTLDWVAQSATGFDEIEAPSGDGSIDFGSTSQTITADIDEASGFMLELDHSAATLTNATTMLLFDIAETGGVDNAKAISVDTAGSETFYILGSGETWSAGSIESTSHILTGADDTPDEAGEVQYDSTVAGIETGALAWYDGDEARYLVDLDVLPTDDDYVVSYDAAADKFYMKVDADSGGSTAYDDIANPDASGSIAFGAYTGTYTSATDGWGGLIISNTVADMTSADYLLTLDYTAIDGDADADFLLVQDSGGAVFTIQQDGDTTIVGELSAGAAGFTVDDDGDTTVKSLTTSASATPGITMEDSDDAAGTAFIYGNSGGGANDIVMTIGVEDSGGEDQGYIELDGTNETVDVLQPMTVSDVTVDVLTITGADANPSAAGDIVYDNDISTLTGGALMWQDDDATDRIIVDLDTAPALDEYVIAYSQADDKFYMKEDADSAGATRWDAISDPTNNGETIIDFDNAGEKTTLTTVYDAAGSFFKIDNTDADLANNTYLLDLEYTDDGQANADFLKCSDNNGDVKFSIQEEGNTAIAGTLGVTGAITSSVTLAGNPVLTANKATPAAYGILFEGTVADNYEGLLAFPAASSDKTQTFQNVTGTVYCSGGTLIPVGDGGTGASSLTDGGVLLGSGTGAITAMAVLTDGQMIVGDGTTDPVAESGATLRTSIGVGTGDSPQFTGVELGHATDTTLARTSAGVVTIEGAQITTLGATIGASEVDADVATQSELNDVAALVDTDDEIIAIINASPSTYVDVAAGGTGVGTFTDHGVLVGSGAADITALAAMTDGQLLIGDTDEDPVLATLTGTANEITVTGGAGSITLSIPDSAVFVTPSMNDPSINVDGSPAANSTYSGVVITGINAGEAVTQNQLVFMASDGKWDVADANDAGHFPAIGMAVAEHGDGWPAADGDELSVLTMGVVRYDAWAWTDEGVVLYLDDTTAGSMIEAAGIPSDDGDCVQVIGRVLVSTAGSGTNDSVYINPSMDWFLDDGT